MTGSIEWAATLSKVKCHAADTTKKIVSALLPDHITRSVQERSCAIYQAFNCRDLVRVDHFWTGGEDASSIITIEMITVPGFSGASIFPKSIKGVGMDVRNGSEQTGGGCAGPVGWWVGLVAWPSLS